ncbi:hypothetical protein AVEN_251229-1 [Araneus ventricosus]|uniref:Uncharacterized protein n=1 Tax=Araneus ventricosus TaxID=182803 RepID=A0A4Y2WYQ6_ARAVE|nr:hypothetical protein AVEN_251229-1 [Araneus ventricosus]
MLRFHFGNNRRDHIGTRLNRGQMTRTIPGRLLPPPELRHHINDGLFDHYVRWPDYPGSTYIAVLKWSGAMKEKLGTTSDFGIRGRVLDGEGDKILGEERTRFWRQDFDDKTLEEEDVLIFFEAEEIGVMAMISGQGVNSDARRVEL